MASGQVSTFYWCIVSLLVLHFSGGAIFSWLEREAELEFYKRNQFFYRQMREMYEFDGCKEEWSQSMDFCKKQKAFAHRLKEFYERSGNEMVDHERWTFAGAVFFVSTLVTTLGYGTYHPRTTEGQAFTVVFGLIGIPVMGYVLSQIAKTVVGVWMPMCPSIEARHRRIFVLFCLLIMLILLGGVVFSFLEPWTFLEACYFSTCSLLSIGFGDYIPRSQTSRAVTMVFVMLGLGVAASFIALLQIHVEIRGEHFALHLNSWYDAVSKSGGEEDKTGESPRSRSQA